MTVENSSGKMLQFKSLSDFLKSNPSEQDCIDYYEQLRWKGNPISPHDPTSKVWKCKKRKNWYVCKKTGKYFNVKKGTIFENSKISLRDWFLSLYLFSSKKGVSSCQLARYINTTRKTALFVSHRLRYISNLSLFKEMLKNFVEIDETFIGGKNSNRHWNKKVPNSQGRSWKDKTPVLGMIERGGNLICQVISNTQKETIEPIIRKNVKENANIYTDEWFAYKDLNKWFKHQIVNHRTKQYVNGEATTNRIENPWSHLKRSIYGTYHQVSRKHLQKYVNEFTMRYNTRKYKEQERFDLLLSSAVGKRLTYQQLTG